jgi:hypothetical protein
MKKINLNLEIEFADKIIGDVEIETIMKNVLNALISEVNSGNGIAPENIDTFTKSVKVSNRFIDFNVEHKF